MLHPSGRTSRIIISTLRSSQHSWEITDVKFSNALYSCDMHHHYNSYPVDGLPVVTPLGSRLQGYLKEIPATVYGGVETGLSSYRIISHILFLSTWLGGSDELYFLMHYYTGLLAFIISMYFSKYSGSMYVQYPTVPIKLYQFSYVLHSVLVM